MYKSTKNILKSATINASIGVRQGAPSSCLLIVIYIDHMVRMIKRAVGDDGFLGMLHVLLLMDDAVIVATSREMCLKKMEIVNEFCRESGMKINETKTKFFVINGDERDKQCLTSGGVSVSYTGQYLYLGAWFTESATMDSVMALHQTASEAIINKFSIFCASNTTMPFMYKRVVFDAAVTSALLYGAESWFTGKMKVIEKQYSKLVKCLLGVRKNTSINLCMFYDTSRPTAVLTDYSRQGLGFIVMQQYCQCVGQDTPTCCPNGWKLVLCGSRHLTAAKKNYSTLEGEALAIAWCLKKARLFLLGCKKLTFVTDHKALTKIFGDKELKDIHNPRILNIKERTLMYNFRVRYIKGKTNCAADALSRYPALASAPEESDEADDEAVCAAMAAAAAEATTDDVGHVVDLHHVKEEALKDEEYQLLHECVANNGWGERKDSEPAALRPYFRMRRHLSCHGDIVLYTSDERFPRLVIPATLRRTVLNNLHAGHQGRDSMLRRARQSVYWPGIDAAVEQKRRQCLVCETHAPSYPAEPLLPTPPPQLFPFQQAVADLFHLDGSTYIAYADRLTGWLEVEHLPGDATSPRLIALFRRWFTRFGIPETLSCDGGTNLTSHEARKFFDDWCVNLRVSSSHYAQSNGRAEAAVRSAKRLLRGNITRGGSLDTDGVAIALLQYLNTPLHDLDASPAQLLTGRQLRDAIPVEGSRYLIDEQWGRALRARERAMIHTAVTSSLRHDQRAHQLTPLGPGQRVRIQNPSSGRWDRMGTVIELSAPRQYLMRLDGSGRAAIRNRRHLRPLASSPQLSEQESSVPAASPESPVPAASPRPHRIRRAPKHLDDYFMNSPA